MSHGVFNFYTDVKNRLANGVQFVGLSLKVDDETSNSPDIDCFAILNAVVKLNSEHKVKGVYEFYYKFGYNLINLRQNFPDLKVGGFEDTPLYTDYGQSLFNLNSYNVNELNVYDNPYSVKPQGYDVALFDRTGMTVDDAVKLTQGTGFKYLLFNHGNGNVETTVLTTKEEIELKRKKMVPEIVETPKEFLDAEEEKPSFWGKKKKNDRE